jgi:Protein of unknown function (DUF2917)
MMRWHLHDDQDWAAPGAGWLVVDHAPVWLTRHGEWADHVLWPGQRLAVAPGDQLRLGAWGAPADGQRLAASLRFEAAQALPVGVRRLVFLGGGAAGLWRRAAEGLRAASACLAALARSAEARASRAQGCA